MGILDFALEVSTAQNVSPQTLFQLSTNVIDLKAFTNIGAGERLYMEFQVTTAFAVSSGTPEMQFGIVVADNDIFTVNPVVQGKTGGPFIPAPSSPALLAAVMTLGARFYIPIPDLSRFITGQGGNSAANFGRPDYLKKFIAAVYWQPQVATAAFSAGSVSARIVVNPSAAHALDMIFPASTNT